MKKYLRLMAFTLLIFLTNGCAQKKIFVKPPKAHLQTWELKPLDINITYEVYDEDG